MQFKLEQQFYWPTCMKTDSGRSSLRLFLSPTAEELTLMENGTRRRPFPFIIVFISAILY